MKNALQILQETDIVFRYICKHNMIKSVLVLLLCSLGALINAQHTCGFDHYLEANPEIKNRLIEQTKSFQAQYKKQQLRRGYVFNFDTVYEIKVVFHVLYNNTFENVPDSCIYSQMEVLNEDFNRTNPDTSKTLDVFKPVGGSLPFKFVLADKDPNGNATNGIVRKSTNITAFNRTSGGNYDSRMKFSSQGGSDAWDPDTYLNIWVCDMFGTASGGVAGYATPPLGAENWPANVQFPKNQQGAVVHFYTVGRYNPRATANGAFGLGRTTTHELGHYFGLFHTWGLRNNTCSELYDDYIDDTPNSASPNSGCNTSRNSCQWNEPGDLVDMVQNYMDYSSGSCQNIFTKEQAALMFSNMKEFREDLFTPLVSKDSTFVVTNEEVTPILLSNPGSELIIGSRTYTSQTFSLKAFDLKGREVITDYQFALSEPIKVLQSVNLGEGQYLVVITDNASGESFTYKYQKISNIQP